MAADSGVLSVEADIAEVRAELELILVHTLFSQSRRYPALLRHVVERTLDGRSDYLKERSIGIEVFDRKADYDVASDPVVRVTAAEVRKRLAQYYYDPANLGKVRIELAAGSYVPHFRRKDIEEAQLLLDSQTLELPSPSTNSKLQRTASFLAKHRVALVGVVMVSMGFGAAVGYWLRPAQNQTQVEQFWRPVLNNPGRITLCVGAPKEATGFAQQIQSTQSPIQIGTYPSPKTESISDHYRSTGLLATSDLVAAARVAAVFSQGKKFHIADAAQIDFSQLQAGPLVLIGAVDNAWTMRLTQDLRYGFSWNVDSKIASIVDHKTNRPTSWSLGTSQPYRDLASDYAIVARYRDTTTGQQVVIVAGLGSEGTEAASEAVSDPSYLESLLRTAPRNWQYMNFEAVLKTKVINGEPGPPIVTAVYYW